jgi:hypothetical protein
VRLALESLSGAMLYAIIILALWWVGGRPNGPETYCLERFGAAFESLRAKFRKSQPRSGNTIS